MWKCMRKCPRFETCSLSLYGKECSHPEYMYYKPGFFERIFGEPLDNLYDWMEEQKLKQDILDEEKYANK